MNTEPPEEIEEYKETEEERRMRDERFIEKFFTERELIVDFDDTSESDEENAQAWYEAVEKTIRALPIYQHDNMGRPLNIPDTTNTDGVDSDKAEHTLIDKADNKSATSKIKSQAWFFRGQKDVRFAFTSSLYRRLLNTSPDRRSPKAQIDDKKAMARAERSLITKARNIGIGRELTALEILTLLQHHGSPTRLIDVTSDWEVALYFACEGDDDRDGRTFLINTNLLRWKGFPKEKSAEKRSKQLIWQDTIERSYDLKTLLENPTFPVIWTNFTFPILLPFSDPRMIAQRGFFLTGEIPPFRPKGKQPIKYYTELYTTVCPQCKERRCECSDSAISPRSIESLQEARKPVSSLLNLNEFRMITSLPIKFKADKTFLHEITTLPKPTVNTDGYSIRVPKHFKRKIREILRDKGVHADSMYPPLRETVRLFEYVVDESFKK